MNGNARHRHRTNCLKDEVQSINCNRLKLIVKRKKKNENENGAEI